MLLLTPWCVLILLEITCLYRPVPISIKPLKVENQSLLTRDKYLVLLSGLEVKAFYHLCWWVLCENLEEFQRCYNLLGVAGDILWEERCSLLNISVLKNTVLTDLVQDAKESTCSLKLRFLQSCTFWQKMQLYNRDDSVKISSSNKSIFNWWQCFLNCLLY